jgi:hypothetical protein
LFVVNGQAGGAAMCFERDSFGTLDAFERPTDRIGFAAQDFKLSPLLKVVGGFRRTAKPVEDQSAIVKRPRIAATAFDGRIQAIEGLGLIAGKESVNAAAI